MKRRLIVSLSLSLATLVGCQTDPTADSETVERGLSSSCGAQMPELRYWNGEPLPTTKDGQIYLFYTDPARRGEVALVLVDVGQGQVVAGYRAKQSQSGSLLDSLGNAAQFAGGRIPVPPRPVVPDWSLAAALVAWGQAELPMPDIGSQGGVCK
jgi:hypothetical protein